MPTQVFPLVPVRWKMEPKKSASLLLSLVVGLSSLSGAQGKPNGWATGGPKGDEVSVLATRDNVLFVATRRGLYKSSNWGNRWELSLAGGVAGRVGSRVTSVTIDPSNPSVVFATMDSSDGRPLFKSTDGGESWRAITAGLEVPWPAYGGTIYHIQSLAIDPVDSSVVYAGTAPGGLLLSGVIMKSLDGGESWQLASTTFVTAYVMDLEIDPEDRRTLYAITHGGSSAVFKSTDGGTEWTYISDGLPGGRFLSLRSIVIDPRDHETLYVSTTEHGVYRTRDAGETWQPINDGLPLLPGYAAYPIVEALSWDQEGALYAALDPLGLFKTVDGGDHWIPMNFGAAITGMSAGAGPRSLLYVVGPRGIYRSADGGDSWSDAGHGIVSSVIADLAVDPTTPGAVYAGTGSSWPAYDWDSGDGRWMPPDQSRPGVYRSVDRGRTWSRTAAPVGYVSTLEVDSRGAIYAGGGAELYESEDHGITWRRLDWRFWMSVNAIAIDEKRSILYVGTSGLGVYKTQNDGESWSALNNGFPDTSVMDLAIDPTDSRVLFAATGNLGVYKTVDGGGTWRLVNGLTYRDGPYLLYREIVRVAIDPSHPQTIYAGALGGEDPETGGVFRSDDGGMTWRPVSDGLSAVGSRNVWDLVVDPRDSHRIYIATYDGVFQSQGEEISWRPMNDGMSDLITQDIALDPHSPGALYVGTGAGVFTLDPLPLKESATARGGTAREKLQPVIEVPPATPGRLR